MRQAQGAGLKAKGVFAPIGAKVFLAPCAMSPVLVSEA